MTGLESEKTQLESRIAELKLDETKPVITEEILRQLFVEFKGGFVASRNIPEIKKFIGSYVDKVIIYNEHVDVIFKFGRGGDFAGQKRNRRFYATITK